MVPRGPDPKPIHPEQGKDDYVKAGIEAKLGQSINPDAFAEVKQQHMDDVLRLEQEYDEIKRQASEDVIKDLLPEGPQQSEEPVFNPDEVNGQSVMPPTQTPAAPEDLGPQQSVMPEEPVFNPDEINGQSIMPEQTPAAPEDLRPEPLDGGMSEEPPQQSVAGPEDLAPRPKETQESKEVREDIYERLFKLGKYNIAKKDLEAGQDDTAPAEIVEKANPDKIISTYESEGQVNSKGHKMSKKPKSWYASKLKAVKTMAALSGNLEIAGFTNGKRLMELAKLIASNPDYCSYKGLQKLLAEGKATQKEIYGGEGILNFILAFQRSVSPMIKQGMTYEDIQKRTLTGKEKAEDLKDMSGAYYTKFKVTLEKRKAVKITKVQMKGQKTVASEGENGEVQYSEAEYFDPDKINGQSIMPEQTPAAPEDLGPQVS
ncbi:hypothetical protein HON58_01405, partial [Candidatus Peregrinibacteria bacterium]|nr:hypothetical protein [Candidatus Peregrinibacteria bacterium]